jgi:hypothetical protein
MSQIEVWSCIIDLTVMHACWLSDGCIKTVNVIVLFEELMLSQVLTINV